MEKEPNQYRASSSSEDLRTIEDAINLQTCTHRTALLNQSVIMHDVSLPTNTLVAQRTYKVPIRASGLDRFILPTPNSSSLVRVSHHDIHYLNHTDSDAQAHACTPLQSDSNTVAICSLSSDINMFVNILNLFFVV